MDVVRILLSRVRTVARSVGNHAGAIAVSVAPVVGLQVLATETAGAVLPKLVGAEGADLASRRRHLVGGALATVIDDLTDKTAALAGKRLGTAPFEQPDTRRCELRGARLHACAVEQVVSVPADATGVPGGGGACAEVAVVVEAAAATASHRACLDPATFAREGLDAAPVHPEPVAVA